MRAQLLAEVGRRGVVTRQAALDLVPVHVIDKALASGVLCSVFPGIYALPSLASDLRIQRMAALRLRPGAAVSHLDALDEWGLLPSPDQLGHERHITVGADQHACRLSRVVVHRRRGFTAEPPGVLVRNGLALVRLEQAIVESWPLLPKRDRRVPSIVAIRERRTTGTRLLDVLEANPRAPHVVEMRHVFGLVADGCHSPLELWGHENVFIHPSLPTSKCQVPMTLSTGGIYLDRYFDEERLNVELDGAAYHGEPGQRERDIRRDAELATFGIQVVRFSHQRLFGAPDSVRREVLAILAVRRQQLGLTA